MEKINTTYVCKQGWQPTCQGIDVNGEIVWDLKMKEPWHLKMFPVNYGGDFKTEWMWLCLHEKGLDWKEDSDGKGA